MNRNIAIRVDSSSNIGTGHLMRCLVLSEELKKHEVNVFFISNKSSENLISNKGFEYFCIDEVNDLQLDIVRTSEIVKNKGAVDCLIVDHYSLDIKWEKYFRSFIKRIMVIDDLANRKHDCDYLLDQNYFLNEEDRYSNLLPQKCIQMLGPKYAILSKDFLNYRQMNSQNNNLKKHLLVSFGGSDISNQTDKVIQAFKKLNNSNLILDVILGSSNPHKVLLENNYLSSNNINFYHQINNMAEMMFKSQLSIGAGGITTWERCCLGLPSIVISIADNQIGPSLNLHKYGAIKYIGDQHNVSVDLIAQNIATLLENSNHLNSMKVASQKLVDGNGCFRIIEKILN